MATNAQFVAALQGLTVTGVTRHYDEPPAALSTADLPAAFPLLPGGSLGEYTVSCMDHNKVRNGQFVICVEPVGQGTLAQNYGQLAALMDNLETALDALTTANFINYELTTTAGYAVAETDYWAIVASITMREV